MIGNNGKMTAEQVKLLLKGMFDDMTMQCESINAGFGMGMLGQFRANARTIRSFIQLIRLHQGRTAIETPAKFKKLYTLAAIMNDSQIELLTLLNDDVLTLAKNTKLNENILAAQIEWKKMYNKSIIEKLGKLLLNHNYDNIPPAIFNNFFSRLGDASSLTSNGKEAIAEQ